MSKLIEMKASININPVNGEKTKQFVGEGRLVGSIGTKDMVYTNSKGVEKSYRLATAKVNIKGLGERALLLQVHQSNIEKMEDGVEGFESGENYLTTVRLVKKTDGTGMTLLGNISHLTGSGSDNDVSDDELAALGENFDADQAEEPVAAAAEAAPSIGGVN